MNYSGYLTLYSGGADSTYFLMREKTAKSLLHYMGLNAESTKIASANALRFGKYLTIVELGGPIHPMDGEINEFHALVDTQMALNASITAISFGMKGIVMGFNRDDLGIDIKSLTAIVQRVKPGFKILTPLSQLSAKKIRAELAKSKVPYVSCMVCRECGCCPKCERGY